jgi:type II secretory pathway component PulF
MPVYSYNGLNYEGLKIKGFIETNNKSEAIANLKESGIFVTEISQAFEPIKKGYKEDNNITSYVKKILNTKIERKPKSSDIIIFFKELYALLNAGIPLYDAIYEQKSDVKNAYFKKILSEISLNIKEGKSFSDCLANYPLIFSNLVISSVKAGEESGSLAIVLNKISIYMEERYNTIKKIKASLVYPLIMSAVGFLILFYIVVYVVPIISKIFKSMHHDLPLPTRIVLFGSFLFSHYLVIFLLLIILLYILFKKYTGTKKGKYRIDNLLLKTPLIGKFIILNEVNQFSQSLHTLLLSGITINRALTIASSNFQNSLLKEALANAKRSLEEGKGLSGPLSKSKLFPPIFTKMIRAGEKSSNLEEMLLTASNIMKSEIDFYILSLTQALEPIMVIFMGFVVGFIVISIMLPIFEMSSIIKK